MRKCTCFIEFKFNNIRVFNKIKYIFSYIKELKEEKLQIDDLEYRVYERIKDFYNQEELNYFWWPTKQENEEFWNKYKELPKEERQAHLDSVPSDFETVFNEIGEGEYRICDCVIIDEDTGRLYFDPVSYPYGGSEMMEEVIRSFGGEVVRVCG